MLAQRRFIRLFRKLIYHDCFIISSNSKPTSNSIYTAVLG